jgi:hypothetical protein
MMGTTSSCAMSVMNVRLKSWLDFDLTFLRITNVTSPSRKTEKRGIEFVTGSVIEASGSAGGKRALRDTLDDCIIFQRPSDFCSSACRRFPALNDAYPSGVREPKGGKPITERDAGASIDLASVDPALLARARPSPAEGAFASLRGAIGDATVGAVRRAASISRRISMNSRISPSVTGISAFRFSSSVITRYSGAL